jgi:hypothetical protein
MNCAAVVTQSGRLPDAGRLVDGLDLSESL